MYIAGEGTHKIICSGTEIGSTKDGGGIFLTARHCVANINTNKIFDHLAVSFSGNQLGPYYDAKPIALSLTDDIALLYLVNGSDVPFVRIKDERRLHPNSPIFNVSHPLGTGEYTLHGEYLASAFFAPPLDMIEMYPQWQFSMPFDMTIAPGSSGSGLFSESQRALIGVVVGTTENGGYNIAIPSDRVIDFLMDIKDNTVTKFIASFPEQDADVTIEFN